MIDIKPATTTPDARHARGQNGIKASQPCVSLSTQDLALIDAAHGDLHRLARALLIVWARAEHLLAPHPSALPDSIMYSVSTQLGLTSDIVNRYKKRPTLPVSDVKAVQDYLHLHPFTGEMAQQLRSFLYKRVTQTGNTASLLDAADEWVVRQGILRPTGKTTIERIVYRARHEAEEELFAGLAQQLSQLQCDRLDALCQADQGKSALAMLVAPPHAASARAIRDECHRLALIRSVLPSTLDWMGVQPERLDQWADIVKRLSAQALRRYPPAKRYALLLAFLAVRAQEITDVIVEMFDTLIGRVFTRSTTDLREMRVEQTETHLTSARIFRRITKVLLDPTVPSTQLREEIFQRIPRERVSTLVEQSQFLDQSEVEALFAILKGRYTQMREFTRIVLQTLHFGAAGAATQVLQGLESLRMMDLENRKKVPKDIPLGFVPRNWMSVVAGGDEVNRRAWEFCLLFQTRQALRAGDLRVEGSRRYAGWRAALFAPDEWEQRRTSWFAESGFPQEGVAYLKRAEAEVQSLSVQAARQLSKDGIAQVRGGKLIITEQEQLQVPPTAAPLRRALISLLPRVGLPELLLEVDSWTMFTSAFVHLTARREPTVDQLSLLRPALFAVLVAEATNIGLTTMSAASGIPHGQLVRVYDWYIREETLRQANELLLHFHQNLPLAAAFGSGAISASSTIHLGAGGVGSSAHHHPSGSTRALYSHVSDQGTQRWVGMIDPLVHEATYLLEGVLAQHLHPVREHTADAPGSTELLFGLLHLLGYQFAPPLRDLSYQSLIRAEAREDYGTLDPVLSYAIPHSLIEAQWDELNRLVASLKDGRVTPALFLNRVLLPRKQDPLSQALREIGRIARTQHILTYLLDPALRQRILRSLIKAESLDALARALFFGQQGRFSDRGAEARLNRALALGLVMNAIVVWNTRYLDAAAAALAKRGQPVPEDVWPYLSPILWEHLHLVGDYRFDTALASNGAR